MNKEIENVWSSSIDGEMITGLTDSQVQELIKELNDAVMQICLSYGVK